MSSKRILPIAATLAIATTMGAVTPVGATPKTTGDTTHNNTKNTENTAAKNTAKNTSDTTTKTPDASQPLPTTEATNVKKDVDDIVSFSEAIRLSEQTPPAATNNKPVGATNTPVAETSGETPTSPQTPETTPIINVAEVAHSTTQTTPEATQGAQGAHSNTNGANTPNTTTTPENNMGGATKKKTGATQLTPTTQINIATATGVKTTNIKNTTTLEKALTDLNIDTDTIRATNGKRLNTQEKINPVEHPNKTVTLYTDKQTPETEEIVVDSPIKYVDDPTLPAGTQRTITEGKNGKAIKTKVTTTNLSVDPEHNHNAQLADPLKAQLTSTDEELTIIEAPTVTIIKKGTGTQPTTTSASSTTIYNGTTIGSIGNGVVSRYSHQKITELQKQTQNKAVQLALAQLGKPYVWGATGANAFDCSGLIYWIYRTNLGKPIPRVAGDQGAYAVEVGWDNIQPGDIIWLNNEHIGLAGENHQIIHASTPQTGVIMQDWGWAKAQGYKVSRFM